MAALLLSGSVAILIVVAIPLVIARRRRGWQPRWSTSSSLTVELGVSREEALLRAADALARRDIRGNAIISESRVEARTGLNWKTFGDVVTVACDTVSPDRTVVTIRSRPAFPQLYDWGRSRSLVDAVARDLLGEVPSGLNGSREG